MADSCATAASGERRTHKERATEIRGESGDDVKAEQHGRKASASSPDCLSPETAPGRGAVGSPSAQSVPPHLMYMATALAGLLCAVLVYQSYGNPPPSPQALGLIQSLEKHGYAGPSDVQVKERGFGSPDLLTDGLKQNLTEQWTLAGTQDGRNCHSADQGGAVEGGTGVSEGSQVCRAEAEQRHCVVFDAGSTGTRLHVFFFQCQKGSMTLMREIFNTIKPGLSESVHQPEQGAASLQPMLDVAMREVPAPFHNATPLVFKATAGFRLLSHTESDGLLVKIREKLNTTDFQFSPENINIMSGKEEGLFEWMTVTYLSGTLTDWSSMAAAMDLGGGSMQITYQPISKDSFSGEQQSVDLLGTKYSLYTHSYLGLGLMKARKGVLKDRGDGNLTSDCLPAGYSGVFSFGGQDSPVRGADSPSMDRCWQQVGEFLQSTQTHKPWDLVRNQQCQHVYMVSYFYDSLQWAGVISNETEVEMTVGDYYNASQKACQSPGLEQPFLCQDLVYITRLLGEGFLLWNVSLHVVREINSHETSWSLGAALHELTRMSA